MRIIAGAFRGRKLSAIRGMAIRPTADRVREALFNILSARPVDATVLDLFAGTGALGLEALSRGAARAVFVDQAPAALQAIRKNIQLCRMEANTQVIQWNIRNNLNCLRGEAGRFDLIFLDPPYNCNLIPPALAHVVALDLAAPEALIVAEHDPAETIDAPLSAWETIDQRRYGQTQLTFLAKRV